MKVWFLAGQGSSYTEQRWSFIGSRRDGGLVGIFVWIECDLWPKPKLIQRINVKMLAVLPSSRHLNVPVGQWRGSLSRGYCLRLLGLYHGSCVWWNWWAACLLPELLGAVVELVTNSDRTWSHIGQQTTPLNNVTSSLITYKQCEWRRTRVIAAVGRVVQT